MTLLLDIGNTHTHVAWSSGNIVSAPREILTRSWFEETAGDKIKDLLKGRKPDGAALCSVVPSATQIARNVVHQTWGISAFELTCESAGGLGIDYPKPNTIGPDRLANALAAKTIFGSPVVVVDFGTAVTFDVVNQSGDYVGGIIAPGLSAMTDYLHEKTALLPRIKIRKETAVIGKSTEQAMLIGAVHGYRGLIRGLLCELKRELRARRLPVVATGGYAELLAESLPEISQVVPGLTLDGVRIAWAHQRKEAKMPAGRPAGIRKRD